MLARARFDGCYDSNALQESIFNTEVEPLLDTVFNGLNTTVFAYGNTGAGNAYILVLLLCLYSFIRENLHYARN